MNEEQYEGQRSAHTGQGDMPGWMATAQKQWKIYAGLAFVVTLVIAGMFWYTSNQETQNTEAATHLSRIRGVFELGEFETALTADTISPVGQERVLGLLEIADTYGSTDAGKVASLMAGNCLVNLGAAELYEQAANKALKTGLEAPCLFRAGLCYERSGNNEKAAELYRIVAKQYEVSEVAPSAKTGLARLGMAID